MSPSQLQALQDVKRTGNPWQRVFGQSQHGGWNSVMRVLWRMKWIKTDRADRYVLTEAGRKALKEAERR